MAYVYQHTNQITGEFYIGYRAVPKKQDLLEDLMKYLCSSPKVKEKIKASPHLWHSTVLSIFDSIDDAFWHEQELIKINWESPLLLNRTYHDKDKGHAVFCRQHPMTEDHKRKISVGLKGRVRSESHCQALSRANTGKKLSQESIEKARAKNIGRKRTPEQIQRLSDAQKGHIISEETRRKISQSRKGQPQPKGSESYGAKKVICLTTGKVYGSISDVITELKVCPWGLRKVMKGKRLSIKGMTFAYFEE